MMRLEQNTTGRRFWRGVMLLTTIVAAGHLAVAPAQAQLLGVNLLDNASFESINPGLWQYGSGDWNRSNADPAPGGGQYYYAPDSDDPRLWQDIDLEALGYDSHRLATGGYYTTFGGWQRSEDVIFLPSDEGRITLREFNSVGGSTGEGSLGWVDDDNWIATNGTVRVVAGTTRLQYYFEGDTVTPPDAEVYLDSAYVIVDEYAIWTWGTNSTPIVTTGSRDMGTAPYVVGGSGVGGVCISNAETLTNRGAVTLGDPVSSYGTVDVHGGIWDTQQRVTVGEEGTGTVNLETGTWTSGSQVFLGDKATGNGTVNLTGGTWDVQGPIYVGDQGRGTVNVVSGQWTTPYHVRLGVASSGSGTIKLMGGLWNAQNMVFVGGGGAGLVDIDHGTWTTSTDVRIGSGTATSVGGEVLMTGGAWNAQGPVYVGYVSEGAVNIDNGTWTTSGDVRVGSEATGDGTINMTGGMWHVMGGLQIGANGRLILDGGMMNLSGDLENLGAVELRAGQLNMQGTVTSLNGTYGGGAHIYVGPTGRWETADLTLGSGLALTLQGGVLAITGGGGGTFTHAIEFTNSDATIELDGSLIHAMETLALNGGSITGRGYITTGAAGVDLGTAGAPGSLLGTSAAERIVLYGDVSGTGTMENVTVYGNVSVGNSPGEMSLTGVLFGSGSSIDMEIMGLVPATWDRLLLGDGTDFGGCPIDIDFVGVSPNQTDTFDLFDPLGGVDLASILGTATISTPQNWLLNTATGAMSYAKPGDADLDGDVDLDDFVRLKLNFGTGTTWGEGDFNQSGTVDLDDFVILKLNFGTAAVPEPATLTLLALGGLIALRRPRS